VHPPVNPATAPVDSLLNQLPFLGGDFVLGLSPPVDSLLNQLPFLGGDFVLGLSSSQLGFSAVEKCKQTVSTTNQVGRLTI